jgi:hypothetical protein
MVAQHKNRISEEFWHSMDRPSELVREHPLPSMLLMFGVGLGVGVLVGQTLCGALADMAEQPGMTERIKRQAFEALSHVVSPSMLRQLKDYTS